MAHSLVFALVPAGETFRKRFDEDGFDIDNLLANFSCMNANGEYQRFRLDAEPDPELDDWILCEWKMSHLQARLELLEHGEATYRNELTADVSLERLVELLMRHRTFARERYWIDGEMISAESPANPFPKLDWGQVGGSWKDEFPNPPPWERPVVFEACHRCGGEGEIQPRSYVLPRFLRLTSRARADEGVPELCQVCNGTRGYERWQRVTDPPEDDFLKSIPQILLWAENMECWPTAVIDLEGAWHDTEGVFDNGRSGEEEPLDKIAPQLIRAAPEGTMVLIVDAHM
ncbi:MAG: hypothetical protein ACMVY4_21050 [Minwuia sp.]|uniref:hypothetical protein n=1 Tax=Minwuia sp. TaxID=2493630 RepID=UPI003A8A7584